MILNLIPNQVNIKNGWYECFNCDNGEIVEVTRVLLQNVYYSYLN